jgi:hypothetical protein
MRLLGLLTTFLGLSVALSAQTPALPSEGEGLGSRTEKATLWINPMVIQPSIFLSPAKVDPRTDRKWWRTTTNSPLNYTALEQSIATHYTPTSEIDWQNLDHKPGATLADPYLIRLWQLRQAESH